MRIYHQDSITSQIYESSSKSSESGRALDMEKSWWISLFYDKNTCDCCLLELLLHSGNIVLLVQVTTQHWPTIFLSHLRRLNPLDFRWNRNVVYGDDHHLHFCSNCIYSPEGRRSSWAQSTCLDLSYSGHLWPNLLTHYHQICLPPACLFIDVMQ